MSGLRTLITIIGLTMLSMSSKAQKNVYESKSIFNASKLFKNEEPKIGVSGTLGQNEAGVDFGFGTKSVQYGITASYDILRFLSINISAHKGTLKGGPLDLADLQGVRSVSFTNDYFQYDFSVRLMPMRLFIWENQLKPIEYISYLYFGLGYGNIHSKLNATNMLLPEFGSEPKYKGTDNVFIQEIGIDIPIVKINQRSKLFIGFNYRYMKSNTDYLDGFKPTVDKNLHNDVYSVYSGKVMFKF